MSDGRANASDAELAAGVVRGRREALAEVYRRYGGAVFGLARALALEDALAEEVAKDVFIGFWERPESYDPARGSLRTFLLTVAHERSVGVVRSDDSRRERAQSTWVRGVNDLGQKSADHGRATLDRLPDVESTAIKLAYFGGCTYHEVATLQNEPASAIKAHIRIGLARLENKARALEEGNGQLTHHDIDERDRGTQLPGSPSPPDK